MTISTKITMHISASNSIVRRFIFMIILIASTGFIESAEIYYDYNIYIDGTIEKGDFDKFTQVLFEALTKNTIQLLDRKDSINSKKNLSKSDLDFIDRYFKYDAYFQPTIILNSTGGNVEEALKIGRLINQFLLTTEVNWSIGNLNENEVKCYSACFFIWAGGADRKTGAYGNNPSLGIHRAFFHRDAYSKLDAIEAKKSYEQLKVAITQYLEYVSIPTNIIEKIFLTSSSDLYILEPDEVWSFSGEVDFLDELLISRCGAFEDYEDNDSLGHHDYFTCLRRNKGFESGKVMFDYFVKNKQIDEKWPPRVDLSGIDFND